MLDSFTFSNIFDPICVACHCNRVKIARQQYIHTICEIIDRLLTREAYSVFDRRSTSLVDCKQTEPLDRSANVTGVLSSDLVETCLGEPLFSIDFLDKILHFSYTVIIFNYIKKSISEEIVRFHLLRRGNLHRVRVLCDCHWNSREDQVSCLLPLSALFTKTRSPIDLSNLWLVVDLWRKGNWVKLRESLYLKP